MFNTLGYLGINRMAEAKATVSETGKWCPRAVIERRQITTPDELAQFQSRESSAPRPDASPFCSFHYNRMSDRILTELFSGFPAGGWQESCSSAPAQRAAELCPRGGLTGLMIPGTSPKVA